MRDNKRLKVGGKIVVETVTEEESRLIKMNAIKRKGREW